MALVFINYCTVALQLLQHQQREKKSNPLVSNDIIRRYRYSTFIRDNKHKRIRCNIKQNHPNSSFIWSMYNNIPGDGKDDKISTLSLVIMLVVICKCVFISFALMAVCYR